MIYIHTLSANNSYSFAIKFTHLIPGNVCLLCATWTLLHFRYRYGTIALSYPLFLLMIHHEVTRLNANRNPAPKGGGGVRGRGGGVEELGGGGVRMCNSAESMVKAMYTWY